MTVRCLLRCLGHALLTRKREAFKKTASCAPPAASYDAHARIIARIVLCFTGSLGVP